MECITAKVEISSAANEVKTASLEEKKHYPHEAAIDRFLDNILDLKNLLKGKTKKLNALNSKIEEFTWVDGIDDECLGLINDLIAAAKDLHSTSLKQYVSLHSVKALKIAEEEIERYKDAIDDLKESFEDLDSIYFYLPSIPGFKETTEALTSLK